MSVLAIAVKHLVAAGVSGDDLVRAIAEMEAAEPARVIGPERKRQDDDCVWVYVIGSDHPTAPPLTKVGISQHPERRMAALERERGQNLYLADTFGPFSRRLAVEIEKSAHMALRRRQETGEWFWCSDSDASKAVAAAVQGARI